MRRAFLDENNIFSPEINMGEDVPYSFKILMSAKRMMVVPDRYYLYRDNPVSLTGKQWKPTPKTLYEKCFVDSRLIYDVAVEVPKQFVSVRKMYIDAARFTLGRYEEFVPQLSSEFLNQFKK